MTVENESSNETPTDEGEATSIVRPGGDAVVVSSEVEEKKLRVVLQVEVRSEVGDGKKTSTDVNKISVVSEHIRAVIRVIGGGD